MSTDEQSTDSRLSMGNPADPSGGQYSPSARRSRKRPLTDRDGITLREELRDLDQLGNRSVSWSRAISRWRDYIRDKRDVRQVFEHIDGSEATASDPHRFHPDYSAKQYAKLKDLERGVQDRYGKRLHTAMLTLTASATPDGEPLPPVDHLDSLLESWSAVSRALRRVLDDRRSARLAILEPHPGDGVNNGYLHVHIAVFIDGKIAPEAFAPVLDAHVRNCEHAGSEAHSVDDIDVRHAGADRSSGYDHTVAEGIEHENEEIAQLAIYLAEYLGTYDGDDPLDLPEHQQAANALLWSTNRQRWRPCQTAQSLMAYDPPETASDWEFVGIERSGEFIECNADSGGISTFETGEWDPPSGLSLDANK